MSFSKSSAVHGIKPDRLIGQFRLLPKCDPYCHSATHMVLTFLANLHAAAKEADGKGNDRQYWGKGKGSASQGSSGDGQANNNTKRDCLDKRFDPSHTAPSAFCCRLSPMS